MKKHFLFPAAVAALLTCACSVEPVDVVDVQPEEEGEITVLTAGFAGAEDETRTVRQADGKVFWSPGDQISILRARGHSKFTADNTEPAASATFSGTMPSGTSAFWAVYPYKESDGLQNPYMVTTLPGQQEAVAGSFADELFISAAYVKNNTKTLTFYHQCGGVKFSVTQPGVTRVTLIPTDKSVYLAGLIGLVADSVGAVPYIAATGADANMFNTVELSAPEGETLKVGEAYHFVTMPAFLAGGFSLLFEKEDGSFAVKTYNKDVTIKAAHFATLMEADKGLSYRNDFLDYSPGEVILDGLGGAFGIHVRGTLEYHIDCLTDWIHEVSAAGDLRVDFCHAYYADRNDEGVERTGMLTICYGDNCYPITVTQSPLGDLKVYPNHSLGMRFTATWCGYCPIMSETFRLTQEKMGDRFEYVCMYETGGDYGYPDGELLFAMYGLTGYPSGIIDGWYELENYDSSVASSMAAQAMAETEALYPAVTAVGLESSLSGRELTVKADVIAQMPETYKITVILMEDGIVGFQKDYNAGDHEDFVHNRVARMTLTSSVFGDEFDIDAAGETKSLTYTATIPNGYVLDNLVVLAYVQRNFNDRPALQSGSYGDWYVDNCRAAAVGTTAPLEVR